MAQSLNTNPWWLGDPEFALRAYVDGTAATVPAWWAETDEDLACRQVAQQLGETLPAKEPCDVETLWARVPRA